MVSGKKKVGIYEARRDEWEGKAGFEIGWLGAYEAGVGWDGLGCGKGREGRARENGRLWCRVCRISRKIRGEEMFEKGRVQAEIFDRYTSAAKYRGLCVLGSLRTKDTATILSVIYWSPNSWSDTPIH